MKRELGLALAIVCVVGGVVGTIAVLGDQPPPPAQPTSGQPAPQAAQNASGQMAALAEATPDHAGERILVSQDGETLLYTYNTTQASGDGVQSELYGVADAYATEVVGNDSQARTLVVHTGGVTATAAAPAVDARASGNLTERAYRQTIEVDSSGS